MPEKDAQCVIPVKRNHSVRWADEMADRFEDVSDEDIELLLEKRDSNSTKNVIKEQLRQKHTQRDLERGNHKLELEEKKLEIEIKAAAKQGNKQAMTVLAKQLDKLRKQKTKSYAVGSKVGAIGNQQKLMHSNMKMAGAMGTTTKTMQEMNKVMDPQKTAKVMQEFERENAKMGMTEEMINDILDDILTEDEENQVLDDSGIEISGKNIRDGCWEAKNSLGHQGLIPEAYVQLVELPEPSFPPPLPPPPEPNAPPEPHHQEYINSGNVNGYDNDTFNDGGNQLAQQSSQDDYDDQSSTSTAGQDNHVQDLQGEGAKREKISPTGGPGENLSKYRTVRKSRSSNFVKAGGEAFLRGQVNPPAHISESDKVRIVETTDGPIWEATESYKCEIKSQIKKFKLKGLKSVVTYQVIPSFSKIQVSRDYKHFEWLRERLKEKFICIPVPPLPDKAIAGRYKDENERMKQLQYWMDRMVQHPVISHSDVFNHFLTCTDEKKWKQRKEEKDEFVNFNFFYTLDTPRQPLDVRKVECKMEIFQKFVKGMDGNVKHLIGVFHDNRKRHTGPFKKEFCRIGDALKNLAVTFKMDIGSYSRDLTGAIDYAGDTYNQIGEMYAKQPEKDLDPMHDMLYEYKGILSVFPDVLKVHEGTLSKSREYVKLKEEGKMEVDVTNVIQQSDIVSYGTMAEIQNFQRQRVADFKKSMQVYLGGQIEFYKEITRKLEEALAKVDNS